MKIINVYYRREQTRTYGTFIGRKKETVAVKQEENFSRYTVKRKENVQLTKYKIQKLN